MAVADSVEMVRNAIRKAQKNSALASAEVTLLGASKGQGEPVIRQAIQSGIHHFGENRVQEAQEKWPALKEAFPQLRLHLIGPLQTNKVRQALGLFDVIQTIDREKLADAMAEELAKQARDIACLIQVNIGKEDQKAGVMPEEADALIEYCKIQLRLPLKGLMCIPPHGKPPAPYFAMLRNMAQAHGLPELSMGMSEDYEAAVRMGATCVRLGRVLFGERLA
jgi:PLP dependent protein